MRYVLLSLLFFASPIIQAQNVPNYVPTDGLVGWWPFNGNANDESGNGNNGTVNGATLTEDRNGVANAAYKFFTGQEVLINNTSSLQIVQDISISFWVYPYSNGLTILRKGNDYGVDFANNNGALSGLYLIFFSPNLFSSNQLLAQTWSHVTVVKNSANRFIYVDGLLNSTSNSVSNFPITNNPFTIGSWNYETIDATVDDIGIWNRALTDCEIEALYLAQLNTLGCTQAEACNYNPEAICDDGSCIVAPDGFDCLGNCITDYNLNGISDAEEIWGCTYPSASNYNPNATDDDGSCNFSCPGDINNDEIINTNDLLLFLTVFGQTCQ